MVVVDDSLVRGTTSRKIVKMFACRCQGSTYADQLAADRVTLLLWDRYADEKRADGSSHTSEEIRKYITADSLAYLSLDGMLKSAPGQPDHYCTACFTERYPISFTRAEELQLGLFEASH